MLSNKLSSLTNKLGIFCKKTYY